MEILHKFAIMEKLRIWICVFAALLACLPVGARRERNYIYLFDCTQSMRSYGIWEQARNSLDRTLTNHSGESGNRVYVVPFQADAYPEIEFDASEYLTGKNRERVSEAFTGYITKRTNTSISAALNSADALIDPLRDNRIYLFTDGEDTRLRAEGVARMLRAWCGKYPNTRLFYIMLHKAAEDKSIVNVADMCRNIVVATPVNGAIPEYVDIEPTVIYTSTLELDRALPMSLSIESPVGMHVECTDPFFKVELIDGKAKDGKMALKVSPRDSGMSVNDLSAAIEPECDAEGNYEFPVTVVSSDSAVFVLNPDVTIYVANRPQRAMDIFGGERGEAKLDGASWYDRFLFWGASAQDTICIPVYPRFNEPALSRGASQKFRIMVPEGQPADDFTLICNGEEFHTGDVFSISTTSAPEELGLVFAPDAKEGKRYFTLIPLENGSELERLNGMPVEDFADEGGFSFRSSYSVVWNPLKIALVVLCVLVFAALLLWFCVIKPIRYPGFKARTMEIKGPDTYYKRVHFSGASRLVLTSQRHKQSALSRIFTGTTLYVQSANWNRDILIVPATKNKVKVKCPSGWSCTPGFILSPGMEYLLHGPQGDSSKLKL